MAPTGHALELLRMPERILLWSRLLLKSLAPHRRMALARDVAVQIATLSHRVRELASMLKDGRSSQVVPVMLAEPLPDRETTPPAGLARRFGDLHHRAVRESRAVRAEKGRGALPPLSESRANGSWRRSPALRRRHREKKIFVVRNRAREIAGAAALKSFIGELWQIV